MCTACLWEEPGSTSRAMRTLSKLRALLASTSGSAGATLDSSATTGCQQCRGPLTWAPLPSRRTDLVLLLCTDNVHTPAYWPLDTAAFVAALGQLPPGPASQVVGRWFLLAVYLADDERVDVRLDGSVQWRKAGAATRHMQVSAELLAVLTENAPEDVAHACHHFRHLPRAGRVRVTSG